MIQHQVQVSQVLTARPSPIVRCAADDVNYHITLYRVVESDHGDTDTKLWQKQGQSVNESRKKECRNVCLWPHVCEIW